jgi:predicted TIM-barrel fold metal-dependent hydrolase
MLIDAHHHLWDFKKIRYPWLQEPPFADRGWGDWSELRQDYLLADYLAEAKDANVTKSVHVQAGCHPQSSLEETAWIQSISDLYEYPNAVIAYVDLSAEDAPTKIQDHLHHRSLRGLRQVLNRHPDPVLNRAPRDYLAEPRWWKNIALLEGQDLTFDVQIYPHQIPQIVELARKNPALPLIIDHCGMPIFRDAESTELWRAGLPELAGEPNVFMKLSGMGMLMADWDDQVVNSTLEYVVSTFGPNRCLFGSNFPVDKLRISLDDLVSSYLSALDFLSSSELEEIFSGASRKIYRLD